jgi:hypothetical protein
LKEYFKDLNNEIITIEIPQKQIPSPGNIVQRLLGHQDKPEKVEVIREEQDARNLHSEIEKVDESMLNEQQRNNDNQRKTKEKALIRNKGSKKPKTKRKERKEKQINYNDTSSDELNKLEESEEEKGNEKNTV